MIRRQPSRRTTADGSPAEPLSSTGSPSSGPASCSRPRRPPRPRVRLPSLLLLIVLPALLLYPTPVVPPAGAGRGPLRPDPARDARPRRLGRPAPPGPAVPRQAAAAVLAGHAQLPGSSACPRRPPGWCRRWPSTLTILCRLPARPPQPGRAVRLLGRPAADVAPGLHRHGPAAHLDGLLTLWVTLALLATFEAIRGDRLQLRLVVPRRPSRSGSAC